MAAMGVVPDTVRFKVRSTYQRGYRAARRSDGRKNKRCNEWLSASCDAKDRGQQFVHHRNECNLGPLPGSPQAQIIGAQPGIDADGG